MDNEAISSTPVCIDQSRSIDSYKHEIRLFYNGNYSRYFVINFIFCMLLATYFVFSGPVSARDISRIIDPEVGNVVEVTPGQVFYSDSYVRLVETYEIDRPFRSSMPGAFGFRFSFSVDSTSLIQRGVSADGIWTYYVPSEFSASHGLLGNVLASGDVVGLKVSKTGQMKWFVDNSNYNGMKTVWSRKLRPEDPQPRKSSIRLSESAGLPLFRLVFLGTNGTNVRIRFEQRDDTGAYVRDEFQFPISSNGLAIGSVRGAEFVIRVGELRSKIFIMRAMTGEFGLVPAKESATPPPDMIEL